MVDAPSRPRARRPTTWPSCSPRAAGVAQGRDPHPRRRPPGHGRRARRPVRRRRTTASTSRCRSSGWAASAAGLLSALVAGATLLTETDPTPATHHPASSSASGPPCSGAGPTRRPGSPPTRPSPTPTCPTLAGGQPRRGAPARPARRARRPGEPVRHDRDVRALLRRPARHRPAAGRRAGAAADRSTASRCASSTPRPAPCTAGGRARARSSCAART